MQRLNSTCQSIPDLSHLCTSSELWPVSELVDHIDWQSEQPHSTEDYEKNPAKERQYGHNIYSQRSFQLNFLVAGCRLWHCDIGISFSELVTGEIKCFFRVWNVYPLEDCPTDEKQHDWDYYGTESIAQRSTESFSHGVVFVCLVKEQCVWQEYSDHDEHSDVQKRPKCLHVQSALHQQRWLICYIQRHHKSLSLAESQSYDHQDFAIDNVTPSLVVGMAIKC